MLLTNKTEKIELFGKELILSERFSRDVTKLIAFSKLKKEKDLTDYLIESAICIEDGLKVNYIYDEKKIILEKAKCKWYQFKKKFLLKKQQKELNEFKKQLSKESLLTWLQQSQLFSIAKRVYALEGVIYDEDEKKTPIQKESESVES
jgi:hypothetical protein